jgi:2-hydroxy-3-keto-5-methylthiopentenyl-1-phosphate phosphatase
MKEFVFVSDFDGTLTFKDFYEVVINEHLKEKGKRLAKKCLEEKKGVVHFLQTIFGAMNCSEEELHKLVEIMPFDRSAVEVVDIVKRFGGDFIVLSAGVSYYIDRVLVSNNISDIEVIANKGKYIDGKLELIVDKNAYYYSAFYGVDKEKVVKKLRTKYRKIIYAGDSHPDYNAAINSDLIFARGMLADMLERSNIKYIGFDSFKQIEKYILDNNIL